MAKAGGDTNALPPDGGRVVEGADPYRAKTHKERWKSGLHHASAVYAKQVVSGRYKRQCCKWERLACQRFLDDLKRQGTKDFPWIFDTTRADRILRWFTLCIQTRGPEAGQPVALQDWQIFQLSCVYGFVHKDTGARRFRRVYSKRARGNFKSTEKSGQVLYHLCADSIYPPYRPEEAKYEAEPEVQCFATDRQQARRVYDDAKKIAQASPKIKKHLILPKSNPMSHRTRGGSAMALGKDSKNLDGGAPLYIVGDEYHAAKTSEVLDVLKNGMGKRRQSLLDIITTAGEGADQKPCFREEQYAKQVLQGDVTDEGYAVFIQELDDGDDPHDESKWCKANPCLRHDNEYSRTLRAAIRSEHDEAYQSNDAYKIRAFLTRRMNLWQADSAESYLTTEQLELARRAQVSKAEFAELVKGAVCYGGFDLGKRIDLTGAGAVFLLKDGRVGIKAEGFMPENMAARHERTDRVPYLHWARDGYCTLTPGDVTDNSYVDEWFKAGEKTGWKIEHVGYDSWNATDLAIKMNDDRNNEDFCVEVRQSCGAQNLATKGLRELLLEGKLVIEQNPLFLWCLGNAVEISDNYGCIKVSKKYKDDTQRVDPLAAVLNALALALLRRNNPTLKDRILSGDWSM